MPSRTKKPGADARCPSSSRVAERWWLALALGPVVTACYSPNEPLVVEPGGDESSTSEQSTDQSPETGAMTPETGSMDGTVPTTGPADSSSTDATDDTGEPAQCGDGRVEGTEVCDDTVNDGSYGGCLPDCSGLGPRCGDGVLQDPEVCDDENATNGDGCNNDCIASATPLWTVVFDGAVHGPDSTLGIAVGADGDVVAVGLEALDDAAIESQAWIHRYDPAGNLLWDETYAGPTDDRGSAAGVDVDQDGRAHVAGHYRAASSFNVWARGYDADAQVGYTHVFGEGATNEERGRAIGVGLDGRAAVAGYEVRNDLGEEGNIWLRRLDTDGTEMWTRTHHGGADDRAYGVSVGEDQAIVVVGYSEDASTRNIWVRRYDANGAEEWTQTFDSGASDIANGVAVDSEGRAFVTGTSDGDIWVRAYDIDGAELWTDVFDSGNVSKFYSDAGNAVAVDGSDTVVVAGTALDGDGFSTKPWLRKYTPDGDWLWTWQEYPLPSVDGAVVRCQGLAVSMAGDGTVVVGGQNVDGSQSDAWLMALTP